MLLAAAGGGLATMSSSSPGTAPAVPSRPLKCTKKTTISLYRSTLQGNWGGLELPANFSTFWYLELAALDNLDWLLWPVTWLLVHILDLVHNVVALQDFTEHNVASVQPRGDGSGDEELAAVCVLAGVGHAEKTLLGVLELEVLVGEFGAVDGLAAGACCRLGQPCT